MINSMTGYGRGGSTRSGFTVTAELRSVNHRYADFIFRIPREFYPLEDRIRRLLQDEIRRGRVEVSVALEKLPAVMQEIEVNHVLAEAYCRALQSLSRELSLPMDAGVVNLAQLPEVLRIPGLTLPPDQVWPPLEEALRGALAMLMLQRRDEGENLHRDLSERCRLVEEKLRQATVRAPLAHEEHRVRLDRRFRELMAGHFEESRVLMECAVLIERMGIDEELVRLESHRQAFQKTLDSPDPAGRKLDFIVQEMLREVNTIGSKAADYALAGLVVEIKAELEKIREQIQNIE